jgi:hypothetical protein
MGLDNLLEFDQALYPLLRFVGMEEGGNDAVPDQTRNLKLRIDRVQQRTQLGLGRRQRGHGCARDLLLPL